MKKYELAKKYNDLKLVWGKISLTAQVYEGQVHPQSPFSLMVVLKWYRFIWDCLEVERYISHIPCFQRSTVT